MTQLKFQFMKESEITLKEISNFSIERLKEILHVISINQKFNIKDIKDIVFLSKWIAEEDIV